MRTMDQDSRLRWKHVVALCVAFVVLPASAFAAVDRPDLAPVLMSAGWAILFGSGLVLVS